MSASVFSRFRKFLPLLLIPALCLTLLALTGNRDSRKYHQLTNQLFVEEMTGNTLTMHYTLADPRAFGITSYEPILPCYARETSVQNTQKTQAYLNALKKLDPNRLSQADRVDYTLLCSALADALEADQYTYYEEPLSPSSGMQSQLPILLAEYQFRSLRDVEDYLALLDQTDEYFASLLCFEQEKAATGLLMSAVSLEKVICQCDTIVTLEELDQGSHFLQQTFAERLEPLLSRDMITADQKESLTILHNRLLRTVLLPAYTALGDGLLVLSDPGTSPCGLSSYPQGKDYYEYLVRTVTGSHRSIDSIRELLTDQLQKEYEAMYALLRETPSLSASSLSLTSTHTAANQSAARMLQILQDSMSEAFPALPLTIRPTAAVKPVSPSLREYCAPAFYLTPPLDDSSVNAIYINEKNAPQSLELFTTLAHEGYPGHMYQTLYHNSRLLAGLAEGAAPVRELLWYGGYVEGWALYAEFLSYEYAAGQLLTSEDASLVTRLLRHDRSLLLCLYSLLDIMIHYEGASTDQVARFLERFGITDSDSVTAVFEYIAEEPANYLKYYLGYLELLSLREEAKALWNTEYSDLAFHTFLLDSGPADFSTLRSLLLACHPQEITP